MLYRTKLLLANVWSSFTEKLFNHRCKVISNLTVGERDPRYSTVHTNENPL
jgi:hypothetical protein